MRWRALGSLNRAKFKKKHCKRDTEKDKDKDTSHNLNGIFKYECL